MSSRLLNGSFPAIFVLAVGCGGEVAPAGAAGDAAEAGPDGDASIAECDGGEALPAALVGGFTLQEVGCRAADVVAQEPWPEIGMFSTNECGAALTGVPDGPSTSGSLHAVGESYLYVADDSELQLVVRPLEAERGGAPVLLLETAGVAVSSSVWAIRMASVPQSAQAVTSVTCGVHESWTLHELDGSEAGALVAKGEGPVDADVQLMLGSPWKSSLQLLDPRLAFSTGAHQYFGQLMEWDGTSGSAQYHPGESACMELDGAVSFVQEGDSRVVYADWLVLDVDDRDHDGDSQELMVRRTRLETSPSACP